jgi:hypothetical protein
MVIIKQGTYIIFTSLILIKEVNVNIIDEIQAYQKVIVKSLQKLN